MPTETPRRWILVALIAALCACAAAPAAAAPVSRLRVSLAPVARQGAWRVLAAQPLAPGSRLAGVRWSGSSAAAFELRIARPGRAFGRWYALESGDWAGRTGPWATNPVWIGTAARIQVRVRGSVRSIQVIAVNPDAAGAGVVRPLRTRHAVLTLPLGPGPGPRRPPLMTRAGWGANEALRHDPPAYAPALRFAVVHHTDSLNSYSRAAAPSIVRGIYLYHVLGNGWNDIGYNFLIDRFGRVYEGRWGGITRPLIGAHAGGFNTGAVGIALIGTYQDVAPNAAELGALEHLLAWRLDLGHVNPLSTLTAVSEGNGEFAAGTRITLHAISGHRDTGYTDCPGNRTEALLPSIRAAVNGLGGLRIFSPVAHRTAGTTPAGVLSVGARLSASARWRVRVLAPDRTVLFEQTGVGRVVSATWDGTVQAPLVLPDPHTLAWRIDAGATYGQARAAGGAIPGLRPFTPADGALSQPLLFTPNGDGFRDHARVRWTQRVAGSTRVTVLDPAGALVAILQDWTPTATGTQYADWDGSVYAGGIGASGRYRFVIATRVTGHPTVTTTTPVVLLRAVSGLTVTPAFSPNGDGVLDNAWIRGTLPDPAHVTVRIVDAAGALVRVRYDGWHAAGPLNVRWMGTTSADGAYRAIIEIRTADGLTRLIRPIQRDTVAPALALLGTTPNALIVSLDLTVDEASTIGVLDGSRTVAQTETPAAGGLTVVLSRVALGAATAVQVYARDAAGNRTTLSGVAIPPAP